MSQYVVQLQDRKDFHWNNHNVCESIGTSHVARFCRLVRTRKHQLLRHPGTCPFDCFPQKSVKITKGAVGSTHLGHLNYSSGRFCCLFLLAFPSPVISQFLSKSLKTFCVAQLCSWIVSSYKVSTYNPTNRLHPENRQTGPNKAAYMQTTKCNFPVR
jgi:hypothetical protein